MDVDAVITRWLERCRSAAWWSTRQQVDALEWLTRCEDPELARGLRRERRHAMLIDLVEGGPVARPRRMQVSRVASSDPAAVDLAEALRRVPPEPTNDAAHRLEDDLSARIAELACAGATAEQWAEVLEHVPADAAGSSRAALYTAVIAVNADDESAEIGFLRRAAECAPHGSALRASLAAVAIAAMWRVGAHDAAAQLARAASEDAGEADRWMLLRELLQVVEGVIDTAATDAAAPVARELFFAVLRLRAEREPGPDGEVQVTMSGRDMPVAQRLIAATLQAHLRRGDHENALDAVRESLVILQHVDGGVWVHGVRARGLHALGRHAEALDALDDQLRSTPASSTGIDQDLRPALLRKLDSLHALDLVARRPPRGLTEDSRLQAIQLAADLLETAGHADRAVALVGEELRDAPGTSEDYQLMLARDVGLRTLADDDTGAAWSSLVRGSAVDPSEEHTVHMALRMTAAIGFVREDRYAEAAAQLEPVVRSILARPDTRAGIAPRMMLASVAEGARAHGLDDVAERMTDLALSLARPEPTQWPSEHADDVLAWAHALVLRGRHAEAMAEAVRGLTAASVDDDVYEDLVQLWITERNGPGSVSGPGPSLDDAALASMRGMETTLEAGGHSAALALLRDTRAVLRWRSGDAEGTLADLRATQTVVHQRPRGRLARAQALLSPMGVTGTPAREWSGIMLATDPAGLPDVDGWRRLLTLARASALAVRDDWAGCADESANLMRYADESRSPADRDEAGTMLTEMLALRGVADPPTALAQLEAVLRWHASGPTSTDISVARRTLRARMVLGDQAGALDALLSSERADPSAAEDGDDLQARRRRLVAEDADALLMSVPSVRRIALIGRSTPAQQKFDLPLLVTEIEVLTAAPVDDRALAQEFALARVLANAAAGSVGERHWERALAEVRAEPPLTTTAARIHAAIASSAGDDDAALGALEVCIALGEPGTVAHVQSVRERAAILVRTGSAGAAAADLERNFAELIAMPERRGESGALHLLKDLASLPMEGEAGDQVLAAAADAALRLWLAIAEPHEVPSTATDAPLTRSGIDRTIRLARFTAMFRDPRRVDFDVEVDQLLALYPDDEVVAMVRSGQAISLWIRGRDIEALGAADEALSRGATPLYPDLPKARAQMAASVSLDDPGALAALLAPIPDGMSALDRAKNVRTVSKRLAEADLPREAADLLLAEISRSPIAGDDAVAGYLTTVFTEHLETPAFQDAADRAMASPDGRPARLLQALLWNRAHRRRSAGDVDGAVDDARRGADLRLDARMRRDARRLLASARGWLPGGDERRAAILADELAIGPARPDADAERHAEECRLWAQTLSAAGHAGSEEAWVTAMRAAAASGDAAAVDSARKDAVAARNDGDDQNGPIWERTLDGMLAALDQTPFGSARLGLLWHRALLRHNTGNHDGAAEDIDATIALGANDDLPDYRRVDAVRLPMIAARWAQTPPAQAAAWAEGTVRISEGFTSETQAHRVTVAQERVRALLLLDRVAEAVGALDEALTVQAEQASEAAVRDGLVTDAIAVADRIAGDDEAVSVLTPVWDWYAAGATADLISRGDAVAELLARRGAEDRAIAVWDAVREATEDEAGCIRIRELLVVRGEAAFANDAYEYALALLRRCDLAPTGSTTAMHSMLLGLIGQTLSALGQVDEAYEHQMRSAAEALAVEDATGRLNACILVLCRAGAAGNEPASAHPDVLHAVRSMLLAGQQVGDGVRVLFETLVRPLLDIDVDTHARLRFPDPDRLPATELIQVMAEQVGLWRPTDVLAQRVVDWLDGIRNRPATDPVQRRVVCLAHVHWSELRWLQLPVSSRFRELHDDEATAARLFDQEIGRVLDALRQASDLCDAVTLRIRPALLDGAARIATEFTDRTLTDPWQRWVLDEGVRSGLQLDARAARSADLELRRQLLDASADAWNAALIASDWLARPETTAQIIALRRSSLVLDTGRARVRQAARQAPAVQLAASAEAPLVPEPTADPREEFARAASGSLLAGLARGGQISVRPRPLVRMPDGTIALGSAISALQDGEDWVTPAVVDLS